MSNKGIMISVLVAASVAQLYVPASMIWDREDILRTGKEFRLRTDPVDPGDPFRGRYISLRFRERSFEIPSDSTWDSNDLIYVSLEADTAGFAHIVTVSRQRPAQQDYVEAGVSYVISGEDNGQLWIDYPFDRFYMEETLAPDAEELYRKSLSDTTKITYAIIRVKEGEAVLQDVMIGGVSIRNK